MLLPLTGMYIGTETVLMFCTMKTNFLGFYFHCLLCLVFPLEVFPALSLMSLALNCAAITHAAAELASALPSHPWLSGRTFRGCLRCFLQLHVFQRCLKLPDVSLSAGQTPEPYLTFPKVSAVPGVTPGKDEQC